MTSYAKDMIIDALMMLLVRTHRRHPFIPRKTSVTNFVKMASYALSKENLRRKIELSIDDTSLCDD
jgi:hypothetical protein